MSSTSLMSHFSFFFLLLSFIFGKEVSCVIANQLSQQCQRQNYKRKERRLTCNNIQSYAFMMIASCKSIHSSTKRRRRMN